MAHVIAVAGKGGVGKTTLCGMLIQYLCEMGKGPILAVDADANSNLNEVLGVEVETTLGDVREEIARAGKRTAPESSVTVLSLSGHRRNATVYTGIPQGEKTADGTGYTTEAIGTDPG